MAKNIPEVTVKVNGTVTSENSYMVDIIINEEDAKLMIDILAVEIQFNKSEGAIEYTNTLTELRNKLLAQI